MECSNCDAPVDTADAYCGNCGSLVDVNPGGVVLEGQDEPVVLTAVQTPSNVSTLPPPAVREPAVQVPFRLAYDEMILKKYDAVVLRTPFLKRKRGYGTLYVTDARVVFYASVVPRGTQRISRLMQQTKLEDISGLTAYVTRRISLGLLLLTGLFALATLGALFSRSPLGILVFLILTVISGIFLMVDAANRGKVGVVIKSRENDNSPIAFGLGRRVGIADAIVRSLMAPILIFFPSYSAFDVLDGDPAANADQLVYELGALIMDLQTRGTTAYEHWGMIEAANRARAAGAQ
jgi:hypothetical protein